MLSAAELASMTATVAASLDQSLPLYHKSVTPDGSGHSIETYAATPDLMLSCTISKPSATQLQLYADVIAGKQARNMRFLPGADVREGDRVVYQGKNWRVQPLEWASSYRVASDALIVTIV